MGRCTRPRTAPGTRVAVKVMARELAANPEALARFTASPGHQRLGHLQ